MKFFRIKNYDKYQGKGDGNGKPWIKLHKKIMSDYEYSQLHDSYKAMFLHLLLSADAVGNRFPYDTVAIKRQLNLKSNVKIDVIEKAGLIEEISQLESLRGEEIRGEERRGEEIEKNPPRRRVEADRNPTEKPDVSECITHYKFCFEKKFGKMAHIKELKATTILIPIVQERGIEETNSLIEKFVNIKDDPFIAKHGYQLYLFADSINGLLIGKQVITPIKKNKYQKARDVMSQFANEPEEETKRLL